MFDETIDLQMKSQLSCILQFVDENPSLKELFNGVLDEVIVYTEQIFKTLAEFRFVELLNLKFYASLLELFSSLDVYKNISLFIGFIIFLNFSRNP